MGCSSIKNLVYIFKSVQTTPTFTYGELTTTQTQHKMDLLNTNLYEKQMNKQLNS